MGKSGNPPYLHRYLYGYSNPLVWVDPTGHNGENVHTTLDELNQYVDENYGTPVDRDACTSTFQSCFLPLKYRDENTALSFVVDLATEIVAKNAVAKAKVLPKTTKEDSTGQQDTMQSPADHSQDQTVAEALGRLDPVTQVPEVLKESTQYHKVFKASERGLPVLLGEVLPVGQLLVQDWVVVLC